MALPTRRPSPADDVPYISPKQREKLQQQKAEFLADVTQKLSQVEESPFRTELEVMRDKIFAKYPTDPKNLSSWTVAYYEDWVREYAKVPVDYLIAKPAEAEDQQE